MTDDSSSATPRSICRARRGGQLRPPWTFPGEGGLMKSFFCFVRRAARAAGLAIGCLCISVAITQASILGRPQARLRRSPTPTPTPKPTATPTPKPSPTATPLPTLTPTPTPPSPTATPTPQPSTSATPAATPTPTNVGTEITIDSPVNDQTVSGTAALVSVTLGPDVYWDQLQIDGVSVASGGGNLTWNSTAVANGTHTLMVRVFQQGGTVPIGTAYVSIIVSNTAATSTPTPSVTPTPSPSSSARPPPPPPTLTPTPTSAPQHFTTLSGTATLPSGT